MSILEPDGVTQLYRNACFNNPSWFSDVVVLPVAGSYTIVANPNGPAIGTLDFALYTVPPDATSSIATNGTSVSLTTTVPGQNFDLTFNGTAGQRISLATQMDVSSPLEAGCSPLSILEPDGVTQLYYNSCFNNPSWFSDVVVLPVAGSYTIVANPNGSAVGKVNFALYTVPPDATSPISANGTSVSLTTTVPGQSFDLVFNGTAGQRISLATQMDVSSPLEAGCSPLSILEPDGVTQLYNNSCFNNPSWFSDVVVLPVTGSYTIVANPNGSAVGTVSFTLYMVPSDATATLSPGVTTSLTTTVPGENLSLSFSETVGHRFSLLTSFPVACPFTVGVTAPDGSTQQSNNLYACTSDFTGVVPIASPLTVAVPTLTQSGTYVISLNPSGESIGTAQFTLYDVPADASGSMNIGDPAASYATTVPGQAARVSFTGSASQSVTIAVGETESTPSGGCYRITVLEPDGSTILRGDSSCNASYSSGSLTLPSAGSYTIVVSPTGTTIGTYSIGVTTP